MPEQESHLRQPEMLRYWVWLLSVFGAGSTLVFRILRQCFSAQDACERIRAGEFALPAPIRKNAASVTLEQADSIVYFCRQHSIALLPVNEPVYPAVLSEIDTPPVLLTAKGNLGLLGNPFSFAVVGTRRPSPYTERVVTQIVGGVCRKGGFTVVSGFAKGVDALAHRTALDCGANTIAVLGCGVNVNYPHENMQLRERMLAEGKGLFLSEYLPGTEPFPANFPRRNRILSGLSYVTAVMEAGARSGALVTAQCAGDQGRQVCCVPPADIFDARYAGGAGLLRDGAAPLMDAQDLLGVFYQNREHCINTMDNEMRPAQMHLFADSSGLASRINVALLAQSGGTQAELVGSVVRSRQREIAAAAQTAQPAAETEMPASAVKSAASAVLPDSETGIRIVEYLRANGETYADDIAAALDLDLSELLAELTVLELDGFAESLFGKHYRAL